MKVQCSYCNTPYQLDDQKIPNRKIKFKCRKCQNHVYVNRGSHLATKPSFPKEMVCPKCGQRQIASDECVQCGMTVNKNQRVASRLGNTHAETKQKEEIQPHEKMTLKDEIVDCPKCSHGLQRDDLECPKCGIVIEKYKIYLAKKKQVESEASGNTEDNA
jgi:predicted Zn finger-like uncharacterized protein